MITVRTDSPMYWGEDGEYGPFDEQQTGEWAGWPDFGQVLRYFRIKAKLEPSEFAAIYGKETKDGPISGRQVSRMELEGDIPTNINRRKLIARLLNIPPELFGVAILANVTLRPHPTIPGVTAGHGPTQLIKITADTTKYQENIRRFLALHYTSQVQNEFGHISADIRDLESLERQSGGDLQYYIRESLFSYYLLAAKAVRDQHNYALSHYYANLAVKVAKATQDTDLIATALYTRGRTYLEWGRYGKLERGVLQVQIDKINDAITNFEDAKKAGEDTDKRLHPQLEGLIDMHLSRAYAIRSMSQKQEVPALFFTMLDGAEEKADIQSINDPYERHLVTGSLTGFVKGEYYSSRAANLTLAGKPGGALKALNDLEGLRQGGIRKHFTRSQIWVDFVAADTYMGLEQFDEAAKRAKRALLATIDIGQAQTGIKDLYGRLLQSSHRDSSDVKELGEILMETQPVSVEY